MKILMLGWEFPPFYSGGLGIASRRIAEALSAHGTDLTFAIPFFVFRKLPKKDLAALPFEVASGELGSYVANSIPTSIASPYSSASAYTTIFEDAGIAEGMHMYGRTLFAEVERYAAEMEHFVSGKKFDLLHAHDWITFTAALRIKKHLNIPFVAHVHATEMDRTGGNPDPEIFRREQESLQAADQIIAVSNYTKELLVSAYGLATEKIAVVHNGAEKIHPTFVGMKLSNVEKTVLFLGRLTLQKGPDWFLKIAQKVLSYRQDVQFVIGGIGDMLPSLFQQIIASNLSAHVFCLGFLEEVEREKAFANADVYVMPSVSEPFGLSATEAAQRGVPVVLSHQSGVKEVLSHSLAADFWDVDKMANHILAVLEYPSLQKMLSEKGAAEVSEKTWSVQAGKILLLYRDLISPAAS